MSVSDNERWILSFYRTSEITGAMFFGRLANLISDHEIKRDITKHFADESMHGWYWTKCMEDMGTQALRNFGTYQDNYFNAIGIPTNIMEILAITHIFERRVINQYKRHLNLEGVNPYIKDTLRVIMADEGWHIKWVSEALKRLEPEFGKDHIQETLSKYTEIDNEIFGKFCEEHDERIQSIFGKLEGWRL